MKLSNPTSRYDLKIRKGEKVLEVGGGANPHPRANIVTDKFVDNNYHRSGDLNLYKGQEFIQADGESLPFKDKEFDYVICNHVLEHVDDPAKFLEEQARVAKRGYIETPSLMGEHLHPKESHQWVILEIDNKLVLYKKELVNFNTSCDFGPLFLEHLLRNSLAYKILDRTHPLIRKVQYEWSDSIDYLINPSEDYLKKYFTNVWNEEYINQILPQQSRFQDMLNFGEAFLHLAKNTLKSKFSGRNNSINS